MQREKHIGFEIKVLSNLIKRYINDHVSKAGIEGLSGIQVMIIQYLANETQNRDIYQRDIETKFNIRRSTVTGILQTMERNTLIIRESVAHDARLKRIRLTPLALHVDKIFKQTIINVEEQLRSGLSEEELHNFFATLKKIKKNIE